MTGVTGKGVLTPRGWPGREGQWDCVSPQGPAAPVPPPPASFPPAAELEGEVGAPPAQRKGPCSPSTSRAGELGTDISLLSSGPWPPSTRVPTGFVCFEPPSLSPRAVPKDPPGVGASSQSAGWPQE